MSEFIAIRDRARLAGPTPTGTAVGRTRLDDRYAKSTGQIIRVLAPAGYGKSTLVARWVRDEARPVRWLDLEPIDNDALVLGDALVEGLSDLADPPNPTRPSELDSERTMAQTLGEIVVAADPFVLVLDDVHHLTTRGSTTLIDLVAERLPPGSTVVLIGRAHHHHGSFARLRLEPGIIDVSTADLAFDLSETEAMLTAAGLDVNVDVVMALAEQFEGWPAGLRLAALVLQSRAHQGAEPDLGGLGRSWFVTEYVAEEWLAGLDDADRDLMSGMGCLGRFSAEMCDRILGRSGSAADLRRLVREELVVIPLDQHDDWYRMHPVLSELLSSELRDRDPQRWHATHLDASRWWEDARDIDLAVQHAAIAGDLDRCEELTFRYSGEYHARCMSATVKRWLALFDDERLVTSRRLCLVAAINAPQSGDGESAVRLARLLCDLGEIDDDADDMALIAGCVRVAHVSSPPDDAISILERGVARLPPGAWHVYAGWILGGYLFHVGDDRAEAVLRDAIFEADLLDHPNQSANTQATLAGILELQGRRDEAAELAMRAHARVGVQREEMLSTSALVSAMVAVVEARAGRHDLARDAVQRAHRHLVDLAGMAVWFNVLGRLVLARACLLLDDAATARELMNEVDAKLTESGEPLAAGDLVEVVRAEVAAASQVAIDRTWQLTDAELRVMHYLPTNLSLADIAARLFVSRNTVKSHAAAIYRKLGSTSRGEAVELARQAGLVDVRPLEP